MIKHALFVRLEAKAGKENEVAQFLQAGLGLAQQEGTTPVWFALQLGPSTFGVFDAFADEAGRQAHLNGPIAQALGAKAPKLWRRRPRSNASTCSAPSCPAKAPHEAVVKLAVNDQQGRLMSTQHAAGRLQSV
jgi:quinol monooxygenase YgiN